MTRECGSCSLCCKVMGVQELKKPMGKWCTYARKGVGCTIHHQEGYPKSCRGFTCLWMEREVGGIPDQFKPDKVHAFFLGLLEGKGVALYVDPGYPFAPLTQPLSGLIDHLMGKGVEVLVVVGEKYFRKKEGKWVGMVPVQQADQTITTVKDLLT